MPSKKLTIRTVATVKPAKTRQEIADAHLTGLYLVVQPSGAKSWAVRYRTGRLNRKHTLGSYPAIDLKTARELAAKALRTVAEGQDPAVLARRAVADSFEAIAAEFVERHCKAFNREKTAKESQRLLQVHVLPRWRGRSVHGIARRDVLDLLDRVSASVSPTAANAVLAVIRRLFNRAVERDLIAAAPTYGVKKPGAVTVRDRVLSDTELALVWCAAETLGGPFGALVKLLTITGQRRSEIAGLIWSEVDLEGRMLRLPAARVKNGRAHQVPLSEPAMAILRALPRLGPYALTIDGTSPINNFARNKARLDALLPATVSHWTLHDLRRTAASGMARLGVGVPTVERVLNHVSGSFSGIVGVYQHFDFAGEKRAAIDAWGLHVTGLAGGNVIALRA